MVDVKSTIAGLKKYVDSRQRPVKDAAMASMVTVFKASNGMLRGDLLQGLAKNIAGTLEKSFDAVPADEMGKPAKRAPPKKKKPAAKKPVRPPSDVDEDEDEEEGSVFFFSFWSL
jgi:hypothetical protein